MRRRRKTPQKMPPLKSDMKIGSLSQVKDPRLIHRELNKSPKPQGTSSRRNKEAPYLLGKKWDSGGAKPGFRKAGYSRRGGVQAISNPFAAGF
jgi:hypothetical protein